MSENRIDPLRRRIRTPSFRTAASGRGRPGLPSRVIENRGVRDRSVYRTSARTGR